MSTLNNKQKERLDKTEALAKTILGAEAPNTTPRKLMEALRKQGHKRVEFNVAKAVYMRLRREESKKVALAAIESGKKEEVKPVMLGALRNEEPKKPESGGGGGYRIHRQGFGNF